MYLPDEEERRWLQRRLLPDARREGVAEELRGWRWTRPPVRAVYEAPLGVSEIAGRYCGTGRDVYLRRVERLRAAPNPAMSEGRAIHALVAGLHVEARRLIYEHRQHCLEPLEHLLAAGEVAAGSVELAAGPIQPETRARLELVRRYQVRRLVERVERVLSRQPRAEPDTIAALTLPALVELRLDGTFLGLSAQLALDAFLPAEGIAAELKAGRPEPFHRLATTGYALVLESLYERPIEVGCIVYLSFRDGRLLVKRDYHLIGDELRQWFLDEREEKERLVSEEIDPGLPDRCAGGCPWLAVCRPAEERVETVSGGPIAANLAPTTRLASGSSP